MNSSDCEGLPSQIGRYQVKSLLGQGGMAVVYLAFDPYMEREVAIKVLLKDRSYDNNLRSRFKRESRMVASLNHPAIVPVYDFGEEDEQPYLVMRFMQGGSLRERLRHAPLLLPEVATILNQIAPALDTTHSHNIIHRDLKPSNILFDSNNKAYLADFGLAKFAEGTFTTLTRNDGMVGTPAYMSPEQIRAQAHLDGRTDVYALGVLLFEMLAGKLPFTADGRLPVALMHLSDPVPDIIMFNPSLPKSIGHIITRAMAKSREDRFATASDLTTPFVKAAQMETLPPVEFPNAPPIILQPESESGSSIISGFADVSEEDSKEPLPDWLQDWLAGCGTKQDIGRSRTRGTLEDRLRVGAVETVGGLHLLVAIVSDGSSSQQHGHLAAELAITELFSQIEQAETAVPDEIPEMLHQALQKTNRTLFSVSQQQQDPLVMQSMVALVAIHENRLYIAHVGDGRIYLLRRRRLHQLTRNLPQLRTDINDTAHANGSHSHHSSAIGQQPELHVDLGLYLTGKEDETAARQNQGLLLQTNDRLLLCSDGLIAPNGQRWLRRRLRRVISENSPAEAAKILVQDALDRHVPDNVTAVVLQAPGTVPHVPLHLKQSVQIAAAAFSTISLIVLLLLIPNRAQPDGVFVPPGTATHIAQIINSLTATAVNDPAQDLPTDVAPLIASVDVPEPGFAVIFAAGEGALVRPSGDTAWQSARSGDLVRVGPDTAIQSGTDRMGVVLSDGAELYLAPEAELMLTGVNQTEADNDTTQVSLTHGRMLIHYKSADPHDFELAVPSEAMVMLSAANNVAGVIYDAETAVLELDCFTGSCRMRNNRNSQLLLPTGRYGVVAGTNMTTRSTARVTLYCDLAPTLVACPTPTPAPTQTLPSIVQTAIAATETAVAQTASPTPSPVPSSTPSPTPLPSLTPQPGATSASQPPGNTPVSTTVSPSSTPSSTPRSTSTPRPTSTPGPSSTPTPVTSPAPTSTNTAVPPTSTPNPTSTATPIQPIATSTLRFTATPLPTFTPTKNPNS